MSTLHSDYALEASTCADCQQDTASMEKNICESCGLESPDILPNSNGQLLCPDCNLNQEGSMKTTTWSAEDIALKLDSFEIPATDAVCSSCMQASDELLPAENGTLLCQTCIVDSEEEIPTERWAPELETSKAQKAATRCDRCKCEHDELLPSSTGLMLCPTCIMDSEENLVTQVDVEDVPTPLLDLGDERMS